MKIGLVLDDTLDKPDGVQQYVLTIGAWLAQQGHEVHYLAGESYRTDIPNLHSLAKNWHVTFNGNRLSIPLPVSRRKLKVLLAQEKFDVLHVQTPHSPFMAHRLIMAAPQSTAVIATFHILPHNWFAASMTRLLGVWLRRSLKRCDRLFAVSPAAADFATKSFEQTFGVLPNAVTLSDYTGAKPFKQYTDKPTVLFLGRLVERKGCAYVLQAVRELVNVRKIQQPFRVLICGKGEQFDELNAYVTREGLSEYVTFTGFVTEADKPRYYASADIAVFPSTGGESFGIVLVEAMAASPGVVLGGNNPGYASVLAPYPEQLFAPQDIQAFADKIEYYLSHSKARTQASLVQQQYVRAFDVPVVGTKLLTAYNDALRLRRNVR